MELKEVVGSLFISAESKGVRTAKVVEAVGNLLEWDWAHLNPSVII